MGDFLFGLFEVSALKAVLIAAALLLGRVTAQRFVPQWRYWVWLVLALRLALPVGFALPKAPVAVTVPVPAALTATVWSPAAPAVPPESALPQVAPGAAPGGAAHPAPAPAPVALRPMAVLLAFWSGGALLFLAVEFGAYFTLGNTIRRRGRGAGIYQGLPVTVCPGLSSPLLLGFFRPTIVLPEGLEGAGRDFALLHEWTHHRRHDLWYKLLLVWCNALHWFNPMVWLLRRAAGGDVELACDARLLEGRDLGYRRSYGGALVDQAAGRTPGASLTSAFSGTKGGLRRRIITLLDLRPRKAGRLALALLCAAALLGGSFVACESREEELAVYLTGVESTALHYRPAALYDPQTETVYYRAEDADSDPLPVVSGLDVQSYPAGTGALLTVQNGTVIALKPLSAVETEGNIVLLDHLPAEDGLVRYVHAETGAALDIPEDIARRLLVLEAPHDVPALGESGGTPAERGGWALTFADRRLWADSRHTAGVTQNRLGAYQLYCAPWPVQGQAVKSGDYHLYSWPTTITQGRLSHTNLSDGAKREIVADWAVMQELTISVDTENQGNSAPLADGTYKVALYSVGPGIDGDPTVAPTTLSVDFPGGWDESMGVWWFRNLGTLEGTTTLPVAPDAVYQGFPTRLPNAQGPEEHPGAILRMQLMLSSSFPPRFFLTIVVKDGAVVHLSAADDCTLRRDGLGYVLSYEPQVNVGARLTYAMGTPLTGEAVQVGGTASILLGAETTLLDETGAAFLGTAEEYFSAAQGQMVELTYLASAVTLRLRPDLNPDTETFDAVVHGLNADGGTLTYVRDGAWRRETVPLSPRTLSVGLLNSDGNYTGAWGAEDLNSVLSGGPLPCRVRLSHGQVTEVMEQVTGTPFERFVPDTLHAIYMGPNPNDTTPPVIHWYRLELSFHFEGWPGVDLGPDTLSYRLEFAPQSPMMELIGMTPFDNGILTTEGKDLRESSVSFLTGRNTMTEAELTKLVNEDSSCTLVVTDPSTGAQRYFPMEAVYTPMEPDAPYGAPLQPYDAPS